jgi:CheY-like chemotaxis protein/anti-sigma regulatory factor (Ser/Thr protein kinase)
VRLGQVVSNLIHNAVRYTPPGGEIRVSLEHSEQDAIVRVVDNGQGIPEPILDRVFDMFVQQSAGGGGLGVGLALVKRLIDLHDGSVSVRSDGEGKGSEFKLRLPRLAIEAEPVITPRPPTTAFVSSLKIVVVDDNPDICDLVSELLAGHGHEVAQASTGSAALELIASTEPDAAIVDLGLPDIDGWSVARSARAKLGGRPIRLVAMSGYGSEADRARAFDAGFDAHIVKPAHIDDILRALTEPGEAREPRESAPNGASPSTHHP